MGRGREARLRVLVMSLCAASLLFVGLARPAAALVGWKAPSHASVVSVTPADGARLQRAPTQLVVVFDSPVNPAFVQVTLSSGVAPMPLGPPSVNGGTVTVPVPPGSADAAASYRVAFRVVSADGHPVSGSSEFTVTGSAAAATGAASATAPATGSSPSATTTPAAPSAADQALAVAPTSGPTSGLPVAAAVAGVVVVVAGGLLALRRRRAR